MALARTLLGALALVLSSAAATAAPLLVATSPHFRVFAAEPEAELRAFADGLEQYDAVLHRLTGRKDEGADIVPLTIYVVADQSDVGGGWGVLGYYNFTAAGPLAVVPRKVWAIRVASIPRIVLFHEYAHHFMLQYFPALYSPWFVEGSAEFYSTVEMADGRAVVGKPEPLRIGELMGPWFTTLEHLLAPGDKELTGDQTSELYARGWLLVHYLTLSPQRGGQIQAYLAARAGGQTEQQAFQTAFHCSIDAMNAELKRYFAPHSLSYIAVDLPMAAKVDIRPATDGEATLAKLMPRLRDTQQREDSLTAYKSTRFDQTYFKREASNLAVDARAAARKLPDDADVQVFAAESEVAAGQAEAARQAAAKALQLRPANARAHLALAAATIMDARPDDAAALAAARKEVVAANRAAPDDPLPLIAYYRLFADHKLPVPPIAVQGLERAHQLAPQDEGLRVTLAGEEIALKRYDYAAALLKPVAFSPHPGPRRESAEKLLKSLPQPHEQPPPAIEEKPGGSAPAAAAAQGK